MCKKIAEWMYSIKVSKELEKYSQMLLNKEITHEEYMSYIETLREEAP